jgi:hypothetical protein
MADDEGIPRDSAEGDVAEGEARLKMASGLKACHAMVADYRAKLGVGNVDALVDEHPADADDPAGTGDGNPA